MQAAFWGLRSENKISQITTTAVTEARKVTEPAEIAIAENATLASCVETTLNGYGLSLRAGFSFCTRICLLSPLVEYKCVFFYVFNMNLKHNCRYCYNCANRLQLDLGVFDRAAHVYGVSQQIRISSIRITAVFWSTLAFLQQQLAVLSWSSRKLIPPRYLARAT